MTFNITHVSRASGPKKKGQLDIVPFVSQDSDGGFHFGVDTLRTFASEQIEEMVRIGSIAKLKTPIPFNNDEAIWKDDKGDCLIGLRRNPASGPMLRIELE